MVLDGDNIVLKITAASTNGGTTLRVEGRVAGEWVDELSRAIAGVDRDASITLDLAQVTFVDAIGAVLLRSVAARGVALTGSSDFVSGLIHGGQA
jgi:anti-anti-sigma regulatory factor